MVPFYACLTSYSYLSLVFLQVSKTAYVIQTLKAGPLLDFSNDFTSVAAWFK